MMDNLCFCARMLPVIVYVHARQRNCWLSTTRKPKVHHLSRQTLRHNKASSMNAAPLQIADPSRTANEDEDEDERDDEMSDPTQITRTEKRKEIQTDETAKALRAPLLVADSSQASSLRLSDETQEQLVRSSKAGQNCKEGN